MFQTVRTIRLKIGKKTFVLYWLMRACFSLLFRFFICLGIKNNTTCVRCFCAIFGLGSLFFVRFLLKLLTADPRYQFLIELVLWLAKTCNDSALWNESTETFRRSISSRFLSFIINTWGYIAAKHTHENIIYRTQEAPRIKTVNIDAFPH